MYANCSHADVFLDTTRSSVANGTISPVIWSSDGIVVEQKHIYLSVANAGVPKKEFTAQ